jgi:predicted permease
VKYVQGARWLDDLLQDVRYALRTLGHRPSFAAVLLCTLAFGIGATTVMFTVINGVLLRPLSYPEPERLVALHGRMEKYGDQWGVSYQNFLDCQRDTRSLAPVAAWTYGGGTVSRSGEAEYVEGRQISSELFSVFGVTLANGRAFLPEEDRPGGAPVVIISYGLWQRRYGGRPAIGLPLVFDGKSYTVVGIVPAGFQLDGEAGVFTPLGQNMEPRMRNREANFLHVVGRVRNGMTMPQAQTELAIISQRLAEQYPQANAGRSFHAQSLHQELVGNIRSTLWLLLGAVSLVLLIACVNVASLLLARAVSRERELTMRMALGASRSRLVRQCLTESAVLGLLGGTLGVLLAAIGIRPFVVFWPGSLPRADEVRLDWRVLLFALATSLSSAFFFGLAPALRASANQLEQTLRAGARTIAGTARRLHTGFVMSEIALAVVLLVAAGILGRTVLRLSSLDAGINTRNVVTARVALAPGVLQNPAQMRAAWQDVLDRARRVPGIRTAALSDIIPMRVGQNGLGYWTTPAPPPLNQMPIALASCVTPDYLHVMGIPLRQGRFFDLRSVDIRDQPARPGDRRANGARSHGSRCHAAGTPSQPSNGFRRRRCRPGVGVRGNTPDRAAGRGSAFERPVDVRHHGFSAAARGPVCKRSPSPPREPRRPNERPSSRLGRHAILRVSSTFSWSRVLRPLTTGGRGARRRSTSSRFRIE